MIIENKDEIKNVLENGGVIAYVTDTVWGLGCLPTNEKAVKKIYDIKKREAQKPLILMSNETYNLIEYVQPIPKIGCRLIKKYFPRDLRNSTGSCSCNNKRKSFSPAIRKNIRTSF